MMNAQAKLKLKAPLLFSQLQGTVIGSSPTSIGFQNR